MKQTMYGLCRYLYALTAMGRPLFLFGTVPLYILGVAVAWHETESLHLPVLVLGLVLVWLIQLMTHYNNEYYDLETDRATRISTHVSGGSRVLVQGLVPVTIARIAAIVCLLLATVLTSIVIFYFDTGGLFLVLVVPAFLVGWVYSAGPIKLMCRGMGEVSIVIVTCFLLPMTGYYLQISTIAPGIILLGIPLGLLTFALTLTIELPDLAADISTGKMTLAARLGLKKTMTVQFISFCAGYICFVITIMYILESWVWAALLFSALIAATVVLLARSKSNSQITTIEKLGISITLMIGYASLLFSSALFLS